MPQSSCMPSNIFGRWPLIYPCVWIAPWLIVGKTGRVLFRFTYWHNHSLNTYIVIVSYDFPIWHSLWWNQCWIHRICMAKLQCRSGALVRSYICHINVWRTCCRLAHFLWTWKFGAQKFEWCTQLCVLGTYIKHWHLRGAMGIRDFNSCLELDVQHLRMNIEVQYIASMLFVTYKRAWWK